MTDGMTTTPITAIINRQKAADLHNDAQAIRRGPLATIQMDLYHLEQTLNAAPGLRRSP